ncbi:MAG: hypothetical protein IPM54_39425 [Polyangiaceae bacterium]|nr:hypothetical protein [Polyangiaceae bacterium]
MLVVLLWLVGLEPATMLYISGAVGMGVYATLAITELRRAPLFVSPLSALFCLVLAAGRAERDSLCQHHIGRRSDSVFRKNTSAG